MGTRSAHQLPLFPLLLIPFEKFSEQSLAFIRIIERAHIASGQPTRQELLELLAGFCDGRSAGMAIEPLLSRTEAGPSGHRGVQGDFLPFWMEWRTLEILDLREQRFDEALEAPIAIGIRCPIICAEDRRY